MAKFRMVHTEFWNDSTVMEEFTPEDKFFYLYLLTNANTKQIGIYEITKKQMAFEMGYSIETINSLLDRFLHHHELVEYNEETREIAIKNWGKYNLNRGGKPMLDCVESELKEVKDTSLIKYVSNSVGNDNIKGLYDTYNDTSTSRTQEEEEEKEEEEYKEEEKENNARVLFEHYLSKNIIQHRKLTNAMRTSINARLRDYSLDDLKKAIDNYATVISSDDYWFTHKYPLMDLMREKDITRFLDEADPLNNFRKKGSKQQQNSNFEFDPEYDSF